MGRKIKYFTIEELTRSTIAKNRGIDNTPPPDCLERLYDLIEHCLDPLRVFYGNPIIVSSGYRCKQLNDIVGGSPQSQHMLGEAADIAPTYGNRTEENYQRLLKLVKCCDFDQIILERRWDAQYKCVSTWIHITYTKRRPNRRQVIENLIANPSKFPKELLPKYPYKKYIVP